VVLTTDTIGALFTGSPGVLLRALGADASADADIEAADAGGDVDEDDEVEIVYGKILEFGFKYTYKINLMSVSGNSLR
jgi:hypothetical protein